MTSQHAPRRVAVWLIGMALLALVVADQLLLPLATSAAIIVVTALWAGALLLAPRRSLVCSATAVVLVAGVLVLHREAVEPDRSAESIVDVGRAGDIRVHQEVSSQTTTVATPAEGDRWTTTDDLVVARDDLLLVQGGDGPLARLEPTTGEVRWRGTTGGLRVVAVTDDVVVGQSADGSLAGIDLGDGRERWSQPRLDVLTLAREAGRQPGPDGSRRPSTSDVLLVQPEADSPGDEAAASDDAPRWRILDLAGGRLVTADELVEDEVHDAAGEAVVGRSPEGIIVRDGRTGRAVAPRQPTTADATRAQVVGDGGHPVVLPHSPQVPLRVDTTTGEVTAQAPPDGWTLVDLPEDQRSDTLWSTVRSADDRVALWRVGDPSVVTLDGDDEVLALDVDAQGWVAILTTRRSALGVHRTWMTVARPDGTVAESRPVATGGANPSVAVGAGAAVVDGRDLYVAD